MLSELRLEIRHALESYCDDYDLRQSMLQALSRSDCALHPNARCIAGLLTLKVYEAIRGAATTAAFQLAAAVEMHITAAFMFDNIADKEMDSIQDMGVAEELPISIGLMTCGGIAACEAGKKTVGDAQRLQLLLQLQKGCISSCSGQLLDARLQRQDPVTTEEALEMSCRKSGNVGRSAATMGAMIATGSPETVGLFGQFGSNVFTYLQLVDDLRDACPADGYMRDMDQHKKTLPLVYFYNYLMQEQVEPGCDIIPSLYDNLSRQDIRLKFSTSGAETFCIIVAETFLNRAKSDLAILKDRVRTVEGLEQFISTLEISPDEVLAVA